MTKRKKARKTKRIIAELDRLDARDLNEIRYDQIDQITEHIDDLNKGARQIDSYGSNSLWRYTNSLYGQAVRRRRQLVDVAEVLAGE